MKDLTLPTTGKCSGCGALIEVTYEVHHDSLVDTSRIPIGSRVPTKRCIKYQFACSSCGGLYTLKKGNGLRLHDQRVVEDLLSEYDGVTLTEDVPICHFVADKESYTTLSQEYVFVSRQQKHGRSFQRGSSNEENFFILPGLPGKNAKLFDVQKVWQEIADERFEAVKKKAFAMRDAGEEAKARRYAKKYNMEFIFGHKPEPKGLKEIREFYSDKELDSLIVNKRKLNGCDKKLVKLLPKPPKGAMKAERVWMVESDLTLIACWIPVSYIKH